MKFTLIQVLLFSLCLTFGLGCKSQPSSENLKKLSEGEKLELTAVLNKIYLDDQEHRDKVASYIQQYGLKSPEIKELAKRIDKSDSLNIIKVKSIIGNYGWLSKEMVGEQANSALFLVVQHSSQSDRKYFLPLMRQAVKTKSASMKDLALLEDRVAMGQGKRQIYGTQIGFDEKTNKYFVFPIENPEQVDKRRAKVGLSSLSAYLLQWQISTDK